MCTYSYMYIYGISCIPVCMLHEQVAYPGISELLLIDNQRKDNETSIMCVDYVSVP